MKPNVSILPWFLDPEDTLEHPWGPLITMPAKEFRQRGLSLVHEHFETYKTRRLPGKESVRMFMSPKERRFLRNQKVLEIARNPEGAMVMTPLEFKKFTLSGLSPLPIELERTLPLNAQPAEFWKAFDEVLASAE